MNGIAITVLISQADLIMVLIGGGAVALASFADTSVLSRTAAAPGIGLAVVLAVIEFLWDG